MNVGLWEFLTMVCRFDSYSGGWSEMAEVLQNWHRMTAPDGQALQTPSSAAKIDVGLHIYETS